MTATAEAQLAERRERPILFRPELVRELLAGRKTVTRRPVKNLRVRLRHEVASDLPNLALARRAVAGAGLYAAEMNQHGAVSVRIGERLLGVKPQEFDFVCPYADGHTYLRKYPDGRAIWHLQVTPSRLWVRETWAHDGSANKIPESCWFRADRCQRDATGVPCEHGPDRWRPGIHMPRWACRLVLEVTGVRVERVQDIAEEEARAEGAVAMIQSRDGRALDMDMAHWAHWTKVLDPKAGTCSARGAFACLWHRMYPEGPAGWKANPWVWVVEFRRLAS